MTISDLDRFDQRADSVHNSYAHEAEAILSDRDLNPEAQRRRLDEATARCREQLGQLLTERTATRDAIKAAKLRDLFGYLITPSPTDLMGRRDADERASRLESESAALDALERAELSGDTVLSRSIALAGLTRGWPTVIQRYRSTHPSASVALDALTAIEDEASSGLYGMRYSLIARRL